MWLALTALAGFAAPTPEETAAALSSVNERSPPVGFVFLLDTSQPMEALSEALLPDIAAFAAVIPEGDSLEIIAFHVRPYVALESTPLTAENRERLVRTVRSLDLAAGYDRDLGAGLHLLAEELRAESAPKFHHVFGVSNFCHAPTMLSAWSSGGRGCGPIRNEASIGAVTKPLRDTRSLSAHWFPVTSAAQAVDNTGVSAAIREIGGDRITDDPGAYLRSFAARLPAERARPVAAADAAGLSFALSAGAVAPDGTTTLTLTNGARVLDLTLDDLVVGGASLDASGPVTLAPTGTLSVVLDVPAPPWSILPREDDVSVSVTVRGKPSMGPAPVVSLWALEPRSGALEATVNVPVHRRYGLSGARAAAVLGAVFLGSGFLAVWVRGKLMPVRLGGTLYARHRGGARQPLALGQAATAAIVLTDEGQARLGTPAEAAVVLRARRPLWTLGVHLEVRVGDVEINGQPAKIGVHPVVAGATSLRIGEWRVGWE